VDLTAYQLNGISDMALHSKSLSKGCKGNGCNFLTNTVP
jgi:hypothetical protein